jgi:hypothetical protein
MPDCSRHSARKMRKLHLTAAGKSVRYRLHVQQLERLLPDEGDIHRARTLRQERTPCAGFKTSHTITSAQVTSTDDLRMKCITLYRRLFASSVFLPIGAASRQKQDLATL